MRRRYEATNVAQIASAVVASLSPEHYEDTKNKYIFVNSFTLTQNKVLQVLENMTGDKFEIIHMKAEDLSKAALERYNAADKLIRNDSGKYTTDGALDVITTVIYGFGGINNFSRSRGLWNKRLGLPVEDLKETIARVLKG